MVNIFSTFLVVSYWIMFFVLILSCLLNGFFNARFSSMEKILENEIGPFGQNITLPLKTNSILYSQTYLYDKIDHQQKLLKIAKPLLHAKAFWYLIVNNFKLDRIQRCRTNFLAFISCWVLTLKPRIFVCSKMLPDFVQIL